MDSPLAWKPGGFVGKECVNTESAQQSQTQFRMRTGGRGGGKPNWPMIACWPTLEMTGAAVERKTTNAGLDFSMHVLAGSVTCRSEHGQADVDDRQGSFKGGHSLWSSIIAGDCWQQQQQRAEEAAQDCEALQLSGQLHAYMQHQPCGKANGRLQASARNRTARFAMRVFLCRAP